MFGKKTALAALPYEVLLQRRQELDAEIAKRGDLELETLKQRLLLIAGAQGLSIAELFKERKERRKRQATVRYRNPDNLEETWSGRGKPPRWLQDKLDQGAAKDQFLCP